MNHDWLNLDQMTRHSLDSRQFMDFSMATLTNGQRVINAHNSSGLTFTVLPDRGMDIWSAHYNGIPLTWIAPGSPHPSDYGRSWLSLFNGGLLTTCGLTHVGPPEDGRNLHGNYTRLTSTDIQINRQLDQLTLTATVYESQLFGAQLRVQRNITIKLGQPQIELKDVITNMSDKPAPLMVLYHCNVGYPLIREGAELIVASEVYPRDEEALKGLTTWAQYDDATVGYSEQVFFHHVKHNGDNQAQATVRSHDIGLNISWDTINLPYLTQWKNTRQKQYVSGIEPGNCIPEGRNAASKANRLVQLMPEESQTFDLAFSIFTTERDQIHDRSKNTELKQSGQLIPNCNLSDYHV